MRSEIGGLYDAGSFGTVVEREEWHHIATKRYERHLRYVGVLNVDDSIW